jgi:hypothetical protein
VIESNEKYSWDSEKRDINIAERDLDFLEFADYVFNDPNLSLRPDDRKDYGEPRFLAYGLVGNTRLCICFTPRDGKKHLITIFKVNKKQWSKCYEEKK